MLASACSMASRLCKAAADDPERSPRMRPCRWAGLGSARPMTVLPACARNFPSSALALCWAACHPAWAGDKPAWALAVATAQETPAGFGGPASVQAQLRSDEAAKGSLLRPRIIPAARGFYATLEDRLRDQYGLSYSMDYNLLHQHADQSSGDQAVRQAGSCSTPRPARRRPASSAALPCRRHPISHVTKRGTTET